ncbi:low temperature requirement protein A [Pengzhenrongella phosphoraccumulans]|uniref:low temperature requirement protein A n=1 Tax=Pengzhenrongella phosphoraccumulans TaxID=3114394 RepID=UPI00389036A1
MILENGLGRCEVTIMRTLIRPPVLNTGHGRTASRLELFFDLAYVLVIAELATAFSNDLTWHGAAVFAGAFTAIWFSWVGFTLYANRFDTDDVIFRVIKLAAMGAIVGCAASASDVTGSLSVQFAASYLTAEVLLLILHIRAWINVPEARGTVGVYALSISATCVLWAASLALDGPARYAMWAVAVAIDALTPIAVTLRGDPAPLHLGHLPDRFGLLVILVLGEGIAATVTAAHDSTWAPATVSTAAIGFVLFAAMWWNYFDAGASAGQENLQTVERVAEGTQGETQGNSPDTPTAAEEDVVSTRRDWYIYGHLPLTLGTALAAVGLEDLALHPTAVAGPAALILTVGLGLFFVGLVGVVASTAGSLHSAWPWPMLGVVAATGVVAIPGTGQVAVLTAAVCTLGLAAAGTAAYRNHQLTVAQGQIPTHTQQ